MRAKAKLKYAAGLVEIQRARRIAAEIALGAAKAAEDKAREEERAARERTGAAFDDWQTYLGTTGFAPEISQLLSLRLTESEQHSRMAEIESRVAADSRARGERAWQVAEARTRSSETTFRKLARKVRRREEEEALNRFADLFTYAWSRP